jgi:hypothetical protein
MEKRMKNASKVWLTLMLVGGTLPLGAAEHPHAKNAPKHSACEVHVAQVYDWGSIPVEQLDPFGPTNLPVKEETFTVTCAEPSLFTLHITDELADTVPDSFGRQFFFGLGLHDHRPVGAYALQLTQLAADGHTHNIMMARKQGDTWVPQESRLRPGSIIRFTNGSGIPDWDHQQIRQLTGKLVAAGMTLMRSELPASGSVPFAGHVTIEIGSP